MNFYLFSTMLVKYLPPDITEVHELVKLLEQKQRGVVAHFYVGQGGKVS